MREIQPKEEKLDFQMGFELTTLCAGTLFEELVIQRQAKVNGGFRRKTRIAN